MCLIAHSQTIAFTISYTKYNTYTNNSLYYWLYQNCKNKYYNYQVTYNNNISKMKGITSM